LRFYFALSDLSAWSSGFASAFRSTDQFRFAARPICAPRRLLQALENHRSRIRCPAVWIAATIGKSSQKEKGNMSTSTTNITAAQVKELRERSGAPMMDCKNALTESKGDIENALVWLRKKGIATAAKKAARVTSEGSVASYIHAGGKIGVLVEINCESDFVARTDDFKDLIKDVAMHIAAADPKFVRKEDVTPEAYEKEKEIYRAQAAATGKPPQVVEKIVEGKMSKFYEEVCLLDQPFVKEPGISVHQLIASTVGKLGENISVRRFARFKVGDVGETVAISNPQQDQKAE
jgi:elongation factor Ts